MPRSRHAPEATERALHRELTTEMAALFRVMHAVVRKIPRGRVLTYGQLAELAGLPGGARIAGAAMKRSDGLPWQRVVGKAGPRRGRIAIHDPVGAAMQRQKLAAEGVIVTEAGMIDLSSYGWIDADPPRRRAAPAPSAKKKAPRRAAVLIAPAPPCRG
jgi:methylated-DNA-protein-cysteine methyltransferase related protein